MFRWQYVKNLINYQLNFIFKNSIDLKNNKSYCILPWTHMYIQPDGKCFPCCISNNTNTPLGDLKHNSIEEIWNSDEIKQLRLDLARGKSRPDYCGTCYQKESFTHKSERLEFNKTFFHLIKPSLKNMNHDGAVNQKNWAYWDFRLSNKCNFRCRTCGPIFSTSWQTEVNQNFDIPSKNFKPVWEQGFEFFKQHRQNLEQIYFAGGEPLIIEEHYQLLEWLIANKKTNVVLSYNTNLSELKYKDWDAIELWKKFKYIYVSPSLDHYGKQAEYVRKGTHWEKLAQNLDKIKAHKNIEIAPTITLSLFNVLDFTNIHEYYMSIGIIKNVNRFALNILNTPEFYSISVLPEPLKQQVLKSLDDYNNKLKINKKQTLKCTEQIKSVLLKNDSHLFRTFLNRTTELDKMRNENFKTFYPEYFELNK